MATFLTPQPVQIPDTTASGHPTIVLHEHGDVTLLLGAAEDQKTVRVSAATLQLASPVWKAMLGGQWVESEASEIPLPDDDVEAMLLVLRIAHLRFYEIPKKNGLSFESLLRLAVVCDKYDLVRLVRPFLDLHCWAQPYAFSTGSTKYHPDWLFIAWTFGYHESFDQLARHLALTASIRSPFFGFDKTFQTETLQPIGTNLPPDILGGFRPFC